MIYKDGDAIRIMKCLSSPVRWRIAVICKQETPRPILMKMCNIKYSTMFNHLEILKKNGIISVDENGNVKTQINEFTININD